MGWEQDENRLLGLAAAVQQGSEHPLAGAYLELARERGLVLEKEKGFQAVPGQGVLAEVAGKAVRIGSSVFMERENIIPDERVQAIFDELSLQGMTVTFLAIDGQLAALVAISDQVREKSAAVVSGLRQSGTESW